MTEETKKWESIDELLEEIERVKFTSVDYLGKTIKLAWKEVADDVLDVKFDKPFSEMTEAEQSEANFKLMEAETLARIKAAGENPECFQKNLVTPEDWAKLPKRLKALIISDMFSLMKALEKRF